MGNERFDRANESIQQEIWISPERQIAENNAWRNAGRSLAVVVVAMLATVGDLYWEHSNNGNEDYTLFWAGVTTTTVASALGLVYAIRGAKINYDIYRDADGKRGQIDFGFNKGPKGRFTEPIRVR